MDCESVGRLSKGRIPADGCVQEYLDFKFYDTVLLRALFSLSICRRQKRSWQMY